MRHDGIVARRRIHLHVRHTFDGNSHGITAFARANKRDRHAPAAGSFHRLAEGSTNISQISGMSVTVMPMHATASACLADDNPHGQCFTSSACGGSSPGLRCTHEHGAGTLEGHVLRKLQQPLPQQPCETIPSRRRIHGLRMEATCQLIDSDIRTREVLDWKGVHVLHFMGSSCSQKLRVFLNLKGIPWHSHHIDLPGNENWRPWFLGINPRGLVPVLVHDGAVHIESNDIIEYLEEKFPTPRLIPSGHEREVAALLKHEDDLHLDLRPLSFRFVFAPPGPPKPPEALQSYAANGSGTVRGAPDRDKEIQIA